MLEAMSHDGVMVNSGPLTGTPADQAYDKVVAFLEEKGRGKRAVNYRLRDWLISRQRYWGAPIPIVYCPEHGAVPVPEDQLPVLLPDDVEWRPTGESPLKLHPTWKHADLPDLRRPGRARDRHHGHLHVLVLVPPALPEPALRRRAVRSGRVPLLDAGRHLHGRHRARHHAPDLHALLPQGLRDIGIVQGDEPMLQLRNQGIILGEDSEKMSKSRGNVVAPDELVDRYGADTVRAYLMFFARWDQGGPWNSRGIEGTSRWLRRVWNLFMEPAEGRRGGS